MSKIIIACATALTLSSAATATEQTRRMTCNNPMISGATFKVVFNPNTGALVFDHGDGYIVPRTGVVLHRDGKNLEVAVFGTLGSGAHFRGPQSSVTGFPFSTSCVEIK
jgi:hypothetical protein